MQFTKGVSGNPAGRPRGIKDKRHYYAESIESMIPQVLESIYQKALAGDMTAARMLLDRSLPSKRPEQECVEIQHSGNIASDAQKRTQERVGWRGVTRCRCKPFKLNDKRSEGY